MSNWEPSEKSLYAIHSIGKTQAGTALKDYLESEISRYRHFLENECSANDVASVAYAQAAIRVGNSIVWLLGAEIGDLLRQHNIDPDEEEKAYEDEE